MPKSRLRIDCRTRAWTRGDALAIVGITLLPLAVFYRQALLGAFWCVLDIQQYFIPYHVVSAGMLEQGSLPLWNPYAFSGMPLLGDAQTAMFYPPNWLFFILPGEVAFNYATLIQFVLAGTSIYLYARTMGLCQWASLMGSISYMFSGFLVSRIVHLSILSGAAMLPLVFLCVENAMARCSRWWPVLAALAIALQLAAGHPQIPVYTVVAATLYALFRGFHHGGAPQATRSLLRLAAIYGLAFGFAAVQLIPWMELAGFSPRAAGVTPAFLFLFRLGRSDLLRLIFPFLHGSVQGGAFGGPQGLVARIWEHCAYVGILPLCLAALGVSPLMRRSDPLRPDRRWLTVYLCLLALFSLTLLTGGTSVGRSLMYATPILGRLRAPSRALVLLSFALAMLAALGMDRLLDPRTDRFRLRSEVFLVGAAIVALPIGIMLVAKLPVAEWLFALQPGGRQLLSVTSPNAQVPLFLCWFSAGLLIWWGRRGASPASQAFAAGLVLLDLVICASSFYPTTGRSFYQAPDVAFFLSRDGALFRKITFCDRYDYRNAGKESLLASWSMPYGIADANGFNSLQQRRYTDYLFSPSEKDVSYGRLANERLLLPESPILSSLNVKYLLVPAGISPRIGNSFRQVYANPEVRVFENTSVYPRAWLADKVEIATDPDAVLRSVTRDGFDGRRIAIVELERGSPSALSAGPPAPSDTVAWLQWTPNRMTLRVSCRASRFLVLSEMYFPGWYAFIDGGAARICRTNYLFRGLLLPPGEHEVVLVYRPASVIIGAIVSLLSLAIAALILVGEHRRRIRLVGPASVPQPR